MKKYILLSALYTSLLFSATPEQVEHYLSVSTAEEELLAMESQFSAMQNSFSKDANASENKTYDMQMLSVRFRDYLQKHLSEDEMTEILENYKNVVLLQFVSASSDAQTRDNNETSSYVKNLKKTPESSERIDIVNKISQELYAKEAMAVMFDELMKPLIQSGIGGQNVNDKMLTGMRENYLEAMIETSKNQTLFASKDFTMEELEDLLKIAQTSSIDHESNAVFGAMAYSLKEFFISLSNRYDVSKHQPPSTGDTNHSK